MTDYTLVAETDSYTVVGSYTPVESDRNPLLYESEAALEKRFISILCEQGYTYLPIRTEGELVANLRAQIERLNRMTFTDRAARIRSTTRTRRAISTSASTSCAASCAVRERISTSSSRRCPDSEHPRRTARRRNVAFSSG